jgi:hypothetical protein
MQPAFTGAELGDIGGPQSVGAGRVEVRVHQVRCVCGVGSTGAPPTTGVDPDELVGPHQSSDAVAATASTEPAQLGMDSRGAIVRRDRPWISMISPRSSQSVTDRADGGRDCQA